MNRALLVVILLLVPSLAQAYCQSLQQARRHNPDVYLSWRGNHCWFAPGHPNHHYRYTRPWRRAREGTVSIPPSEGSSLSTATNPPEPTPEQALAPASAIDQVLTEDNLLIHGIENLPLTRRLDDTTSQISSTVVPWPDPPRHTEHNSRERLLRALGVVLFVSVVLAIMTKIVGGMLYGLRRLT